MLYDKVFEPIAQTNEPKPNLAMCSECGWEGPIEECGTETEGDWECGYYDVHLCPKCEDGGCIDDYTMSRDRAKEWVEWCKKNEKIPEQKEGEIGFLSEIPA